MGSFVACAILGGMAYNFFPKDSQGRLDRLIEDIENLVSNANDIVGDKDNKDNIKCAFGRPEKTEFISKFGGFWDE
jgi:hypothetical protein